MYLFYCLLTKCYRGVYIKAFASVHIYRYNIIRICMDLLIALNARRIYYIGREWMNMIRVSIDDKDDESRVRKARERNFV